MVDLVTIDEYKEHEGISSSKEDTKLESIVPSVSQLVKTYCANSFLDYFSTDKVESMYVEWPTHVLHLTETPVTAITSVQIRNNPSESYTTLSSEEYYLDTVTDGIIRIKGSSKADWPVGPGAVIVTYNAGYDAVPSDLRLAVYDLITYYLRDEHKERRTLAGATVQNQNASSSKHEVAFPDHIKRVLDLYKQFY